MLVAGLLLATSIWGAEPPVTSDKPVFKRTREAHLNSVWNSPFTFPGKVVNDEGLPVQGASVHMIIERVTGLDERLEFVQSPVAVVTDSNGRFSIGPVEGWRITLKEIECEGYFLDPERRPSLIFFPVIHPSMLKSPIYFRQDERFPVIFKLNRLP